MTSPLGTILNKPSELKRNTAIVKAGTTVKVGLCYIDVITGGVKNPTGIRDAEELFWIENTVGSSSETKDKKVTVYAVDGLRVIGKANGTIDVNSTCEVSEVEAGFFRQYIIRTTNLGENNSDKKSFVGNYRGHEDEVLEGKNLTTAANLDHGVYDLRGGI